MHVHEAPQPFIGRAALGRLPCGVGRRPQRVDGHLQHRAIQTELASKMVVDGRHVRARAPADVADGDPFEATVGEHPGGRPEQPLAGLQVASAHSVRRNSIVAAVIETTEKISRYPRSAPIASNPVFLSSRFLNAWTAYVNGSTTAIACIHPGNPCCGYTAPLGKYSRVFRTPNIARGISGSVTRTMSRNIRLMSANAVATMTTKSRKSRSGSNGLGIPAMSDPTVISTKPESTALIVPERLKPAINSNFVIGVTR